MRGDGRRRDQLRPVKMEPGYTRYAEGSVLISQGNTVVLCNATVDERMPPWMERDSANKGWVTAEYAMLPRSTHTRSSRETTPQARTQEIRRLIGRSLRARRSTCASWADARLSSTAMCCRPMAAPALHR